MIKICPHCHQRYAQSAHSGTDFVNQCNSTNATLDQEDTINLSNKWLGIANKSFGTRAGIQGSNVDSKTSRGNRAVTHTQRQHYEYI